MAAEAAGGAAIELIDDGGRLALAIDGAVQSVAVVGGAAQGYWAAMLPERPPREALLLGLGGGTMAHLLVGAFGPLRLVGVDDDPTVLALGRAHFGLDLPNLEVVVDDAFDYVARCRRRFDLVCVDLFRDGRIPARVCASPFLGHVRALLRPGGTAVFNLARDRHAGDRLRQLGRHFLVARRILVGFNLVAHCLAEPGLVAPPVGAQRRRHGRPGRAARRAGRGGAPIQEVLPLDDRGD